MKLSGAHILLECFKEQNVDTIFGYPGGAVIPFYDALYDQREQFQHIRTAHEQSAVHAADGYARVTGKVGVGVFTSGPGATNTVTGLANAYLDSVPLVVITGQVSNTLLGRDSFQEIDITGVTLSITKHNYLVTDVNELAPTVREAFRIANSGRKGPVLIDITKDAFISFTEYSQNTNKKDKVSSHNSGINNVLLNEIADAINSSKRPVICAGGGVKTAKASAELLSFASKADIPVVNTLMGLGTIPRKHRLSYGMLGMHGLHEANLAVCNSDLILVVGSRFSDRLIGNASQFATKARVIHIDIDITEIGKNYNSNIALNADVKKALNKLIKLVDKRNLASWHKEILSYKKYYKYKSNFNAKQILEAVNESAGDNVTVVTDVGQHQMWTAQYWKFAHEKSFVTSGGLGTMGFGIGAAIGSQVANTTDRVVLVTGDGSFNMTCNELLTIKNYSLPVLIVILNNNTLGMVRQWQKMFFNERYSETDILDMVSYPSLAKSYGLKGYRVENMLELSTVLELTKSHNEPIIVECVIEKDENVYPIVPPGKSIINMITE